MGVVRRNTLAMYGAGSVGVCATILLLFGLIQGALYPKMTHARRLSQQQFGHTITKPDDPRFFTSTEEIVIQEFCDQLHSQSLAEYFRNLTVEVPFWSACGETRWIDELHRLSPVGSKTFMDIGCNKGFTSAKLFGLWSPEVGFHPKSIVTKRPEIWCGNCGDCNDDVRSTIKESEDNVRVFCFEPSQANFAQLILTRDSFFTENKPEVQWLTINKAMTNSSGIAHFSRDCTSEQCALDIKTKANFDLIDTTTVDDFLGQHEIDYVDILKIDTEGFDATVIQGAMESIARGSVGVISFEYHEVGAWKEYKLKHVVEWLSGFNYVCYFDGKVDQMGGTYARLTGCWHDLYEYYQWSNVVCVPRMHALYSFMEKHSLRFTRHEARYFASKYEAKESKKTA